MICALWVLAVLGLGRSQAADTYRLDSGNTQVAFEVQRFGIRWVTAHFRNVSGEFVVDRPGRSSHVDVKVGIASVDCSDPHWNDRLRSTEWFDAQRYPWMIFHAEAIQFAAGKATASGELTLHGVTQPVVLHVTFVNCRTGGACQFDGHARVKRSDFALPHGFWVGGDQVDISISGAIRTPTG